MENQIDECCPEFDFSKWGKKREIWGNSLIDFFYLIIRHYMDTISSDLLGIASVYNIATFSF